MLERSETKISAENREEITVVKEGHADRAFRY